jgi:cobalt-zinc-cadmium efflux system protein
MHVHAGRVAGHSHGDHCSRLRTGRILKISLMLTAAYILLLVVAGVRARSLALLSEAGHNLSDFFALLLSSLAVYMAERPPSSTRTYGYHRAGVLAALFNGGSLVLISLWIVYQAVQRFSHPVAVHAGLMMGVAAAGVALNGAITWLLFRSRQDLNIRSALIHEVGDTLSTAAIILGGWTIAVTGHQWIDPALSIIISALIIWSSVSIIGESLNILLEGTPRGMRLEEIAAAVGEIGGVNDVHDLHVWSIGSDTHALSCHIGIADIPPSASERILREVRQVLATKFEIHHTTIQFEHAICEIANGCVIPESGGHGHVQ